MTNDKVIIAGGGIGGPAVRAVRPDCLPGARNL